MRKLLAKILSVLLVIIICFTSSICAFASSDADSINLDGKVTRYEWDSNKVTLTSTDFNNSVSYLSLYLIEDNNRLCFGIKASETNNNVSNSSFKIQIDNKTVVIRSNNICIINSGLNIEHKTSINTNSCSIEAKITYPSLNSKTKIAISYNDNNGKSSNKFYIDRSSMTASLYKDETQNTTKKQTTKPKTTKKTTIKNNTTQFNNNQKDTNESTDSNSNYQYQHTQKDHKVYKINSPNLKGDNKNDASKVDKEDESKPNISVEENSNEQKTKGNNKIKKIAVTSVAGVLIIVALALPFIKDKKKINKIKDNNNNKVNKDEKNK